MSRQLTMRTKSVFTCGPTSGQSVLDFIRPGSASTSVATLNPTAEIVLWNLSHWLGCRATALAKLQS